MIRSLRSASLLLSLISTSVVAQAPVSLVRESGVGSVAAHFIGRFLIGSDGNGEVIGYMPSMDGIGGDLFADKVNRSEKSAYFSVRSNKISFNQIQNGTFNHFLLNAATDPAIEFKVYLNVLPDRDFANPASFSIGQHVGTVRLSKGMLTVTPIALDYVANLDLTESSEFTFLGQKYNFRALGRSTLCHVFGSALPTVLSGGVSVPLGGQLTHAGR